MENQENKIIRFNDDDGWRWYEHPESSETLAPSVTTILDQYLNADDQDFLLSIDKDNYRFIMDATAKAGNEIHLECQKFFEPGYVAPKKYEKVMKNWTFLVHKYNIRPIAWEIRVFSKKYGYAGAIDLIAKIDDDYSKRKDLVCVFDIKTGKYRAKAGYQVEAYRQELINSGQYQDIECGVFHLHRDGSTRRMYIYEHHEFLMMSFLSALQLGKADHVHKLKSANYKWLFHNPFREYFGLPQLNQGEADAGINEALAADV